MTREDELMKRAKYVCTVVFDELIAHDDEQRAVIANLERDVLIARNLASMSTDLLDERNKQIKQQAKEIARLREALQACGSKLYEATAYIGYQGVGPLHEPATEMILRRAEEAIKEPEEQKERG